MATESWGYPEDPTGESYFGETPETMAPSLSRMPAGGPLDHAAVAALVKEALGGTSAWSFDGTNTPLLAAVMHRIQNASPEDKARIAAIYKEKYGIDLALHLGRDLSGDDRQTAYNTFGVEDPEASASWWESL